MPGPDAFSNPFDSSQRNGSIVSKPPAAIGSGRGRAGSVVNRLDGDSPPRSSWTENHAVRLRRLPHNVTRDSVRNMLIFARDFISVELIPSPKEDKTYATAIANFKSAEGALQVVHALDGKQAGDNGPAMAVESVAVTPGGSMTPRWYPEGNTPNGYQGPQNSRFSDAFREMERTSPSHSVNSVLNNHDGSIVDGVSPTFLNAHPGNGASYNGQSPIGQPLERQHVSGRSMIQEDGADDETDQIMQDPGSFMSADRQTIAMPAGRRATAPNISSINGRLGSLSINGGVGPSVPPINTNGVASPRGPHGFRSPIGASFSPPMSGSNGMGMYGNAFSNATSPTSTSSQYQPFGRSSFSQALPPVNPADQNPPCNTLYVGNLPMDTSEDELKGLFSKARGYRRLCFRMKGNGPMCFVEFEDISHATRALKDYYGAVLSNSVRGGIRLSFSKNPLGVRGPVQPSPISPSSGHGGGLGSMNFGGPIGGYGNVSTQGFSTASGPPPGLPPPQGFADRRQRTGSSSGVHGVMNGSGIQGPGSFADVSGRLNTFYAR